MSINRFLISFLSIIACSFTLQAWHFPWQQTRRWCIVIHPAGDAQHPGRIIHDTFERSITLQWAELLKQSLEENVDNVTVMLTRSTGENVPPLAAAQMANRLNADLVISLHCYQEQQPRPRLFIYHFSTQEEFLTAFPEGYLYPLDRAYLLAAPTTQQWAAHTTTILTQAPYNTLFECRGPYKLPLSPLLGIICPAFSLEMGIKRNVAWELLIQGLTHSIKTWIENH